MQLGRAGIGCFLPCEDSQQRGFSCPVRSHQADPLARSQLKRYAVENRLRAEMLDDGLNVEQDHSAASHAISASAARSGSADSEQKPKCKCRRQPSANPNRPDMTPTSRQSDFIVSI